MGANLVSLNVNPCKMCMPMGAVSALCGIKNCMSILHGSQGCATYIRRHMATHYNEPVDIASSSLTEEGTVFGGEQNLLKGLDNIICQYDPEIIGVATTCLAETIGEDTGAIIQKYYAAHPGTGVKIINVSAAGYAGTQYEGFFRALKAVVSQTEMDTAPNEFINVVTPMLSPADCRMLKELLGCTGVSYILLPDLSDNLDGGHSDRYERLKGGGTSIADIAKMAGARHTIELSLFADDEYSPAQYLYDYYGVEYSRMALPVGVRDTDAFLEKLVSLGAVIPKELIRERGRYIDAMIDSHKYCAEGRAAIFGEPDFVYSMVRLCCENGVVPCVVSTGSVCPELMPMIEGEIKECAENAFAPDTVIFDDADFDMIESASKERGVNIMIGSSDGRRAAHRIGVSLVRCAFPIHDRVGGQRVKTLFFEGSLNILDQIANILLGDKEEGFRFEIYERFFGDKSVPAKNLENSAGALDMSEVARRTETHPCFTCSGGKYARIHLPIAPKCNIQCNYCVRKFDCPNESRPGVTTSILKPEEALRRYILAGAKTENLSVVGIAGPGDALANFDETRETLRLIREYDPNVTFCLSTNGLMLPLYAQELTELGVSHVTVTINAVKPLIGAKIYKYIDYMGTRYEGVMAASILLSNQLAGLRLLASRGVICKVNIVVLKGINDDHIEEVVEKVKECGAYITNIMQLIPVDGSAFENMELVSNKEITALRKKCEPHLKQMYHCRQCRADAVGTLDDDRSIEFSGCGKNIVSGEMKDFKKYAVASKSGMLVDQHFGHASEFYIYESDGNSSRFIEKRQVGNFCTGEENCSGEEHGNIESILSAVSDCSGVLALRTGETPSKKLEKKGIRVISTYERIEEAVLKAAASQ